MNKKIIFSLLITTIIVSHGMEIDKNNSSLIKIAHCRKQSTYKYNKKINFYLAQLLLENGANPDCRSSLEDPTSLMIAVYNRDQKYARLLLQYNADPEKTAQWIDLTTKTAFEMESTGWLKTMYDQIQQKKELKTTHSQIDQFVAK